MKVQKFENLSNALNFLTGCGIKLVNIGPDDVYSGNQKLILALIWALILHFKIKGGEDNGGNQELLDWVRSKIPDYNIKNFTTDWQSGKALCALAHAIVPDSTGGLVHFTDNAITDCTRGAKYSEDVLGIPPVMDIDDIVNYPDQKSMMTYIAYFREYEQLNARKPEEKKEDLTPDLSKCVVYGVGIEPGNIPNKETYFTIEIRNKEDKKIPSSNHNITVIITGPKSKIPITPIHHDDGTSFVQYSPTDHGNYTIEVKLENQHISESPFVVTIDEPPPETTTEPEPHWFVYDLEHKKHIQYDQKANDLIEAAFQSQNFGGSVEIMQGAFRVDMSSRKELNLQKKHMFGGFASRDVIRGTWFWQSDDKSWAPYTEELSVKLEKHYLDGKFDQRERFQWEERKKKIRWVEMESDGSFKQFRQDGDRKDGRKVSRGYLGNLIIKQTKKK